MKKTNFCDKRSWSHNVGKLWLAARREHLTASEVKNLITDYKRIKAGKIKLHDALQFAKVYGSKMNCEIDTSSFGSMRAEYITFSDSILGVRRPSMVFKKNLLGDKRADPWIRPIFTNGKA